MFDSLIRRMRDLERGVTLKIPAPLDDDGYYDRLCPSGECRALFKVLYEDWRNVVRDEVVFCPTCRHEAPATEWATPDQERYIRDAGIRYLQGEVQSALAHDVRAFNARQPRSGFITMRMSYRPGFLPMVVPIQAAELLRQRWRCDRCGCRYASLGAAFFCPSCGHNSAPTTFDHTMATVRASLDAIPRLEVLFEQGTARDFARHIVENGLVKLVGAYERCAEAMYADHPSAPPARRNVFQTLDEASALWRAAIGVGYEDLLSDRQRIALARFLQQRHLLTHRDGIVDDEYVARSGDARCRVGQRLVVRPDDVRELADVLVTLVAALRTRSAASMP